MAFMNWSRTFCRCKVKQRAQLGLAIPLIIRLPRRRLIASPARTSRTMALVVSESKVPTPGEQKESHVVRHQQQGHPKGWDPVGGPHGNGGVVNSGQNDCQKQVDGTDDVEKPNRRLGQARAA